MPSYTAPLRDMQFVLHELLNVGEVVKTLPEHAEVDVDTINSILEEGARFAAEVIAPLNQSGDAEGCTYVGDGVVKTPKGFRKPTSSTSPAAGRRWPRIPSTAARACRTSSTTRCTKCSIPPTRPGRCIPA